MTRPGIVRADTLDLQDHEAPSAGKHTSEPTPASTSTSTQIASHQASEIRHVMEERHSEELSLRDAWNNAGSVTSDTDNHNNDAGHDTHSEELVNDDQIHAQHNGNRSDDGEDTDPESDDDFMDRMSSSPSIDDGAYCNLLPRSPIPQQQQQQQQQQWPERSSSLTPTRGLLNRSATPPPASTSPFTETPEHLPLFMHDALQKERCLGPPASFGSMTPGPPAMDVSCSLSTKDHNGDVSRPLPPLPTPDHHLHGEYDHGQDDQDFDDSDECHRESFDCEVDEQAHPETQDIEENWTSTHEHDLSVPRHVQEEGDEYGELLFPELDSLPDYGCDECASISSDDSTSSWDTVSDEDETNRDDDTEDISLNYADERFVDSGWGGECLREIEDIDFDFVYALHTFVATVEGQANATKGDTMVLLDDSNSYWWLVRIVKDSSIGYLPAEHIETPTERLARLNKHRNVDLSMAMLGDNPAKSNNPLKKAIRRRNNRTVQFAAPTYVEASDYEYDSEDEENAMLADAYTNGSAMQSAEGMVDDHAQHQENAEADASYMDERAEHVAVRDSTGSIKDLKAPIDEPLGSPTFADHSEAAPLKSRKGTPRNADSFLKDDGAEPRKLTLTPNLLRDDSTGFRRDDSSIRSLEKTRSNSFDLLEKSNSPPDKAKDDKKKKDKKQGMLSGLFKSKKKDKKAKGEDDVAADMEKTSAELSRQSSGQQSPVDRPAPLVEPKVRGKLSKTPPLNTAVTSSGEGPRTPDVKQRTPVESRAPQFVAELEGSQVAYEAPTGQEDQIASNRRENMGTLATITNKMGLSDSSEKPKKAKRAKRRMELDDFNSSDEEPEQEQEQEASSETPVEASHDTFMHGTEAVHIPTNIESDSDPSRNASVDALNIHNHSQEAVSPGTLDMPGAFDPPRLQQLQSKEPEDGEHDVDTTTVDDDSTPVPSKPQSPRLNTDVNRAAEVATPTTTPPPQPQRMAPTTPHRDDSPSSTTSSSHRLSPSPVSQASTTPSAASNQSWSNASLRAWLDGNDNDVRDMLVVIHDNSDVKPVSKNHPLMKGLFESERSRCQDMMGELDGLLGGWLEKRRATTRPATAASVVRV